MRCALSSLIPERGNEASVRNLSCHLCHRQLIKFFSKTVLLFVPLLNRGTLYTARISAPASGGSKAAGTDFPQVSTLVRPSTVLGASTGSELFPHLNPGRVV